MKEKKSVSQSLRVTAQLACQQIYMPDQLIVLVRAGSLDQVAGAFQGDTMPHGHKDRVSGTSEK